MWFETSLDKNFATGSSGNYTETSSPDNNSSIAKWNDINPISSDKFNAVQPNTAEQPILIENAINNLSALRFSGNKFLTTTTAFFDSSFSVFMVVTRSLDGNWRCIISDINPSIGNKLCAGQDGTNTWTFYRPFSTGTATILSSARNTPVIFEVHSKGINASNSIFANLYINSTSSTTITISPAYIGNSGAIGKTDGGDFWSGDIAEIIVFKRMISNDERLDVEKYLAKKYGIKIS
jgi:hypothetical protein